MDLVKRVEAIATGMATIKNNTKESRNEKTMNGERDAPTLAPIYPYLLLPVNYGGLASIGPGPDRDRTIDENAKTAQSSDDGHRAL